MIETELRAQLAIVVAERRRNYKTQARKILRAIQAVQTQTQGE